MTNHSKTLREVSKAKFDAVINSIDGIKSDYTAICEPPQTQFRVGDEPNWGNRRIIGYISHEWLGGERNIYYLNAAETDFA